jgi:hypothetical protein
LESFRLSLISIRALLISMRVSRVSYGAFMVVMYRLISAEGGGCQ